MEGNARITFYRSALSRPIDAFNSRLLLVDSNAYCRINRYAELLASGQGSGADNSHL